MHAPGGNAATVSDADGATVRHCRKLERDGSLHGNGNMVAPLFIGIDGGGTGCRARLCDGDGRVLGEAAGASANIMSDRTRAVASISAVAKAAADAAGLEHGSLAMMYAGLGLAGIDTAEHGAKVADELAAELPFTRITIDNDAYTACLGAHGGGNGGIVIAGTGSAALALIGDARIELGGWGFALGDDGSGALMGRHAIRLAVLALDGLVPATPLLTQIQTKLGRQRSVLATWARDARPGDYASFAPVILAAASGGDANARAILTEAAAALAVMARALLQAGAPRLCLTGGLAAPMLAYLPADVARACSPPLADAVAGALMLARRAAGNKRQ
jgi:glucosamine kinase